MNHRTILAVALLVLFLFHARPVPADNALPGASLVAYRNRPYNANRNNNAPKLSDVDLSGTVETVQPGGLLIKAGPAAQAGKKNPNQKEWLVVPQSDTEVTIEGTATLDYLRRGQLVEFDGQVVNKDQIEGEIDTLTIVDKNTTTDETISKKAKAANSEAAGGQGSLPKEKKPAAEKPAADQAGASQHIVGMLLSRKDRKLTVSRKGKTFKLGLAEGATINVRLSNPKLVKAGSTIEVQGSGAQGKQGNEVAADTIHATLAEPLTGKKTGSSAAAKPAAADKAAH